VSVFKRGQPARSRAPALIPNVSRETRKREDDISCLEESGFSHGLLLQARLRAAALDISPAHILLSEGKIKPVDFYRTFAHHLGANFTTSPPPFEKRLDWAAALATGTARLSDGRWLMAPQGHSLSALHRRLSRRPRHDLIITTPESFTAAIDQQFGTRIADRASLDLPQTYPGYSAREGLGQWQKSILAILMGLACFGLIDGGLIWLFLCALFSAAVAFGVAVRLAAFVASLPKPHNKEPDLREAQLPFYTLLVPLYREANIVDDLIGHLTRLDYPVIAHEILLLVEDEDKETRAAIAAAALPAHFRVIVAPQGKPRTKPRALNIGLLHTRGDLLVIYDAEDRPEPDQLRKAAAAFACGEDKLACLQASLAIENARDSWLTRLFAIDYAGHFDVLLWGWSRLNLPMPLGGTSNHFRTKALRDAGGWDAWNVTEDADLGLRLARRGYSCRMLASTTWEEAPHDVANWLPQRRRWMKGWMQTCLTHTRQPLRLWRELGFLRAIHILALLIANTFGPLVGIWVTVYVLYLMLDGSFAPSDAWTAMIAHYFWTGLALSGFISLFLPTLLGAWRRELYKSLPWLGLRAAHWAFMSIASVQAVYELMCRPYHWAKTRHGLSKARAQDPA
jgi:cellulose synthase/poly-beta-1,6-N-acetylglucosamine synthase-like glycosyltransferase